MSWPWKKCSFLKTVMQTLTLSSSSSIEKLKWFCKAPCTFQNPYKYNKSDLEISGDSKLSSFKGLKDTSSDCSIGSLFLPLQHSKSFDKPAIFSEDSGSGKGLNELKILSYNVWFNHYVKVEKRMEAISDLIELHSPDVICFQEVTPFIYEVFQRSSWWRVYRCSVQVPRRYGFSCMLQLSVKSFSCRPIGKTPTVRGRELCIAEIEVQGKLLIIATSHLESPCPPTEDYIGRRKRKRVKQAKEALNILNASVNVVFAGNMNRNDKLDGWFPLPEGWIDAWEKLRPREDGWTYDTMSNQMLSAHECTLQERLDRFVCKLHDFKISRIEMIGMDAIPGLSYIKERKVKRKMKKFELPVLPSDHYGLLLTICSQ